MDANHTAMARAIDMMKTHLAQIRNRLNWRSVIGSFAAAFLCTTCLSVIYISSIPEPEPVIQYEYIEIPQDPIIETVYVEKEDGCTPYYQSIAETITQEEIDLVAKITWLEAGNQSMAGKRAVVEVIFNRVMANSFPNTIYDVIYQNNGTVWQFATAPNVENSKPTDEEYEAIRKVLNESEPILDGNVLFFSTMGFQNRTSYERIGGHTFCY